jgi:metal-responsive CopG/Arc/MetJ family transcriptional regulator
MKTAVSVPNDLFEQAERLARQLRTSRSRLYSEALRDYLARHAVDEVTSRINAVCDEIGATPQPGLRSAARKSLRRADW